MNVHRLFKNVAVRVAMNPQAAGTSNVNGTAIDTFGYAGVAFVVSYGALTAGQVTQAKLQGGAASDGSDAQDLAGSKTALLQDTQGNTVQVIDLYRPAQRYVRPVVLRGTANAVINNVIAILYHAEDTTQTQTLDATVASAVVFLSLAQPGTA